MGRIVSSFFISLDGVVGSPDTWHMPYFNDEMGEVISSGMETNRAFLMGRELYDEWAAHWPHSDDEPFASYFNDIPKYVVSQSLSHPEWRNTTVLRPDPAAIRRCKEDVTGDIGMSGSATTVRWLLSNGLLDELRLLVHPIAVGHGQRLFDGTSTHELSLTHSTTLSSGVVHLVYRPS